MVCAFDISCFVERSVRRSSVAAFSLTDDIVTAKWDMGHVGMILLSSPSRECLMIAIGERPADHAMK